MEKTSIKNSTIGSRCTINPKTRISDSILMNGVIIEERLIKLYLYKNLWQIVVMYKLFLTFYLNQ